MKIDTLGIQAFMAIADEGSFRKAADALHISQTALTRRLQNLEANLGVKLVERTTRSVALTRIGSDFLPHGHRLLTELRTALVEIRVSGKAQRGDITLACVPTVGVHYLPRIIKEYAARYPDNRIRILDHLSSGVTEAVLRREAEFGIRQGASQHPELTSMPLLRDRYVLICREDHPLADRKKLSWKQLKAYPLIVPSHVMTNRALLDAALGPEGLALQSYFEVQRSSTAVGMVAEGVAAAVVPGLAVQRGAYPNIRVVAMTDPVVSWTLVLLSRRKAQLSPAAQALYEMLREKALSRKTTSE
jgi:DNA-binding transcriptional LysR family regulator